MLTYTIHVSSCVHFTPQAGLKQWQIGKTKVFLKYYHQKQLVELMCVPFL